MQLYHASFYSLIISEGCLYNGEVYSLGELWEVGCEYSCECQNVDTGLYTCNSK